MQKNIALRTAAVLFILAVITGCFASSIFAKNAGLTHGFLPYRFEQAQIITIPEPEDILL